MYPDTHRDGWAEVTWWKNKHGVFDLFRYLLMNANKPWHWTIVQQNKPDHMTCWPKQWKAPWQQQQTASHMLTEAVRSTESLQSFSCLDTDLCTSSSQLLTDVQSVWISKLSFHHVCSLYWDSWSISLWALSALNSESQFNQQPSHHTSHRHGNFKPSDWSHWQSLAPATALTNIQQTVKVWERKLVG